MLLPQHHIHHYPPDFFRLICQTRLPGDPCGKGEGCLGRTVTGQGTWTSKASYTLPTALKKGFHSWLSDVYWKVQSNLASRCPISMIARRNECVQLLAKINLYIFYTYYIIWHIIWCYIQWCLKCQKPPELTIEVGSTPTEAQKSHHGSSRGSQTMLALTRESAGQVRICVQSMWRSSCTFM